MNRLALAIAGICFLAAFAGAQVVATAPPPPAAPKPTLQQAGMYIYPAKDQSPAQQSSDEAACTKWAEAQTGLVLESGSVNTQAAAQSAEKQASKETQGAAVAGAAGGAVAGVAIGAIAGNAGQGAAIGAVAGAMRGMRKRRMAKKEAAQQGAEQAAAANQKALDNFKQAAGACLTARGYSVS